MRPESGERCVSCGRVPHSVNFWHYCTPRSNINTRILPHSTVLHETSRWPMSSQFIHVALRKRHINGHSIWEVRNIGIQPSNCSRLLLISSPGMLNAPLNVFFSHHSGESGGRWHLTGGQLLGSGLADGVSVLLEPFGLHLGLLLDDPGTQSVPDGNIEETLTTYFCSRAALPASKERLTAPSAKARAAAAAALILAGMVVCCFFWTDQYAIYFGSQFMVHIRWWRLEKSIEVMWSWCGVNVSFLWKFAWMILRKDVVIKRQRAR
jgi:hypothetical protein